MNTRRHFYTSGIVVPKAIPTMYKEAVLEMLICNTSLYLSRTLQPHMLQPDICMRRGLFHSKNA